MINGTNKVYFLLGSNMGCREERIYMAHNEIAEHIGELAAQSALYETEPWGRENQPWYLNQAVEVETDLDIPELFRYLQKIEKALGRDRSLEIKWGPRPIDIDVLFYNDEVISEDKVLIPHPQITVRNFVLVPLAEIAGDFTHPGTGKKINELLDECEDDLKVKFHLPATKIGESQ